MFILIHGIRESHEFIYILILSINIVVAASAIVCGYADELICGLLRRRFKDFHLSLAFLLILKLRTIVGLLFLEMVDLYVGLVYGSRLCDIA